MSSNNDLVSDVRTEPTTPIIRTKQAARQVNGQHIEVLTMGYQDRITIYITMEGKLGQLISISLANPMPSPENPTVDDDGIDETPSHLNPKFLLGSANDVRGEIAQLYAVQIATLVVRQSPHERRTLIVGMGLKGEIASDYEGEEARKLIYEVLEMVSETKVW